MLEANGARDEVAAPEPVASKVGRNVGLAVVAAAAVFAFIVVVGQDRRTPPSGPPATGETNARDDELVRGPEPANADADEGARRVLAFLHSRPDHGPGRTVSGQHVGGPTNASLEVLESIHRRTGHWPGIIGVDLGTGDPANLIELVLEHHRDGGLVEVSIHAGNPMTGGGYQDLDVDVEKLITPGTVEHARWIRQLDGYASALREWQHAGVPVILRPFHEMNSSGFWWSYRNTTVTPERFKELWRQTFEHLVEEHGLDNLLWAFTPHLNTPDGRAAIDWYPGDAHVDIVGLDVYRATYDDAVRERIVSFHRAVPHKPFVFGEVGPDRTVDGPWDLLVLRDALRDDFPFVRYFMTWNGSRHGMDHLPNARALLDDPLVANRDDLDLALPGGEGAAEAGGQGETS